MQPTPQPISQRGITICRVCGSGRISSILDLGSQPLPAEYGFNKNQILECFPLHLRICGDCGLGQLGEYVLPDRIFHKNYPYLSSASSTWKSHAKDYANSMRSALGLDSSTLVVELASNDGYLLSEFKNLGIPVLGIEPANNVASIAKQSGIPTLVEFFGAELARRVLKEHGHPKLIVANNVFAHIPDMCDFTDGMAILADLETTITIENPSFVTLLNHTLFDTVYHEHYSYLSAHSVRAVAGKHGLNLAKVDKLKTHGGSFRYWLSRSLSADHSVDAVLDMEKKDGLFRPQAWADFANRARVSIERLRHWFVQRRLAGDVVAGYGAAHKGNTFLNAVGNESKTLIYVVDASVEKQGKFLPGSQVAVIAPEQLASGNPTDVLILPWNIAPEIRDRIKTLAPKARIWVAHPELRQL